jgi:isoleucyl-tRNA synthetase
MDKYDYYVATVEIDLFIEELSNWFVRTSRRRFWKNERDVDKVSAYTSLFETLWTLSKLIAPFTPFISEHIYKTLSRYSQGAKDSVHLESYPDVIVNRVIPEAEQEMAYTMQIVEAGRAARSSANIKTRQPLKEMICIGLELKRNELKAIVKNELNLKAINFKKDEKDLIEYDVGLNFAKVGPKYKDLAPKIKQALSNLAPDEVLEKLDDSIELEVAKKTIILSKEDITISKKTKPGLIKSENRGLSVFLNKELTVELRRELLVREIIRRIQVMRKELDLAYTARIKVGYRCSSEVSQAIQAFKSYVKDETLSTSIEEGEVANAQLSKEWVIDGHKVAISLAK